MTDKASRAVVKIGDMAVDGFMLPDGSYRMSQTQAAKCVGLTERNAREFLQSKAIKSLLGEGYTPAIFEIESDEDQSRGGSRIRGLPIEAVSAYWLWQCFRGNKAALALVLALVTESLERRFDAAFGITKTEQERDDILVQRLERDLSRLGEAYAVEDDVRWRLEYLEGWLRDRGLNPWESDSQSE